ncbi:hypothetical protein JCM18899A_18930 [Nocardioides sp. AN3]
MTRRAPRVRLAHRVPPRKTDSVRGVNWAADHGFRVIDVNCLLSADGTPHAQHGAPYGLAQQGFLPKRDKRKVRDLTDVELARLRSPDGYRVPPMVLIFKAAKQRGVRIEVEAKDDRRFTRPSTWLDMAADAQRVFGDDWAQHVEMKVLTNLSGGLAYALKVCAAAHAAGWPTMILPRGSARLRRLNAPYITLNRGGRV